MNGQEPGWTLNTLFLYFDRRFSDSELATAKALSTADCEVEKAQDAAERRYARKDVEGSITRLHSRLDDLTNRMNINEGRGKGLSTGWGVIVAAIGIVGVASGFIHH